MSLFFVCVCVRVCAHCSHATYVIFVRACKCFVSALLNMLSKVVCFLQPQVRLRLFETERRSGEGAGESHHPGKVLLSSGKVNMVDILS